jgi:hypothetical protein
LTTTETILHEEPFVDARHAVDSTKNREMHVMLKGIVAVGLGLAGLAFGVAGGVRLNTDTINNNTTGQESDIQSVLLGGAVVYEALQYGKRQVTESVIAERQQRKTDALAEEISPGGGMIT